MLDFSKIRFKPPYLIHSDLLKTKSLIGGIESTTTNKKLAILNAHLNLLSNYLGANNLIFPSFNYDFTKTGIFDMRASKSQVGALTNHVLESNTWGRTKTPVFSFLTKINDLTNDFLLEPYGNNSVFEYLYKNDGSIILYGSDISTCTYLHYIETAFGPPAYRYDKSFSGKIIDHNETFNVKVSFHVRPNKIDLEYDWDMLTMNLLKNNIIHQNSSNRFITVMKARELHESWGNIISKDPFGILTPTCKEIMQQHFNIINRRFILSDFE